MPEEIQVQLQKGGALASFATPSSNLWLSFQSSSTVFPNTYYGGGGGGSNSGRNGNKAGGGGGASFANTTNPDIIKFESVYNTGGASISVYGLG